MHLSPSTRVRFFGLCIAALACGAQGCVHRRMTIESNPAGALVLLDGKEVGYTPVSADFTYYGTREVTLIKDGYETQTYPATLKTPWYQRIPLDFFSDNLLPYQITNRHRFTYQMQPKASRLDPGGDHPHSDQNLLDRGNAFRSESVLSK
ncbi:MAG: PEGA domain-containing protein [Planctomycetaceae bacterium]|nr:PEGA domain-containing protein [Planctomycetaceae bacterium]